MAPIPLAITAPAKVNLALHIICRRADGYHELQSLVAFADVDDGDRLTVVPGPARPAGPRFAVDGPFAAAIPDGSDNIVVRAAAACGDIASVALHKGLPVAAGIGGGSADAAAVMRAAAHHRGTDPAAFGALALSLGADVPACLFGRPSLMEGVGERLRPFAFPGADALLVNPGVPVATRDVFAALTCRTNPSLAAPPQLPDVRALAGWLHGARNDLEPAACVIAPPVATVVAALSWRPGCLLARMSGSGATVFALFVDAGARDAARKALADDPAAKGWWIRAVRLAGSDETPPGRPFPADAAASG